MAVKVTFYGKSNEFGRFLVKIAMKYPENLLKLLRHQFFAMYHRFKYFSLVSATLLFSLVSPLQLASNFKSSPAIAQNVPPLDSGIPERNLVREQNPIDPSHLPWVVVSQNRNQLVPLPVRTKISDLFTSQGLSPISCSNSQVVIISVNNLYVACATPNANFPPGTYQATIPNL